MITEPKLLTEAEVRALYPLSEEALVDELRERGLIAEEPVDPLLVEVENIFEPAATENEAKCMILAALRRGMELQREKLTREMVWEAQAEAYKGGTKWLSDEHIDRLRAALLERLS